MDAQKKEIIEKVYGKNVTTILYESYGDARKIFIDMPDENSLRLIIYSKESNKVFFSQSFKEKDLKRDLIKRERMMSHLQFISESIIKLYDFGYLTTLTENTENNKKGGIK